MRTMNIRHALAAAVALLAAGQAGAISLEQAYQAALKNDPTYRAQFYANEAAKENRVLGRSGLLPVLSSSYSRNKNVTDREISLADGRTQLDHPRYSNTSAVVQLRQPLFNMDAVQRFRQGRVQTEQGAEQFKADTNEVALRVVTAYLDALFAEDQLALARVQRDVYLEQQKVNSRLFDNGEGTKTDSLETKARLDLAEAQLIESQDNALAQREVLEGIIGGEAGALEQLAEGFRIGALTPASFEEWSALALKNNKELSAARLAVENARLEIGRNKAGHLPRVDFVAAYSKGDNETINTLGQDITNRSLGVQVNIPIYNGGAINAQTRQAAANYARAQSDVDARTDKLIVDLRRAHSMVLSSGRKVDALAAAVDSSKLLMTATEQSIKGGVRINLDLLNAQQQLFTNQRDLAQARYAYLIGILRMRALTGTVSVQDVREVAAYFR